MKLTYYKEALTYGRFTFSWEDQLQDVIHNVYLANPHPPNKTYIKAALRNRMYNEYTKPVLYGYKKNLKPYKKQLQEKSIKTPIEYIELKEIIHLVRNAVTQLSPMQKKVIASWLETESLKETAIELGLNYNTCKTHYRNALNNLKGLIDETAAA